MTEIAIIGVGEMGRATLDILLRRLPTARFRALDRGDAPLERARALAPDRVVTQRVDIEGGSLDLGGCDLVVNLAGPFYQGSTVVAEAAISAGATYIDICDDVEGITPILDLHQRAIDAEVTLITGAGNSPGMSNVMAKRLIELHPETDGIRVVWVVGDTDPGGLAPLRHMLHMAVAPCPIWEDGEFKDAPGYVPETALEHDLPEWGTVTAYNTAHSEPITLARAFPELRHASVQGALMPPWSNAVFSSLGRIGFGYDDLTVEVDGQQIEPIEVLWKLLWARHRRRHPDGDERSGLCVVQTQALVDGELRASMSLVDPHPMARLTALGTAAAVVSALDGPLEPGAWGVEILAAQPTLDILVELAEVDGAMPGGVRIGGSARTSR